MWPRCVRGSIDIAEGTLREGGNACTGHQSSAPLPILVCSYLHSLNLIYTQGRTLCLKRQRDLLHRAEPPHAITPQRADSAKTSTSPDAPEARDIASSAISMAPVRIRSPSLLRSVHAVSPWAALTQPAQTVLLSHTSPPRAQDHRTQHQGHAELPDCYRPTSLP